MGGFRKPDPRQTGRTRMRTKHSEPQYSSSTTDGEAAKPDKARKMKKEEKECENKEVERIVVGAAEGLPPRKVRVWLKFLKDFGIVYK